MTTTSSDLALTVSATHGGAGKEGAAHLARGEPLAMITPLILDLSVNISRRVALLEASLIDPAHSSDDLAAFAWIRQSLEDVEATIIGLSDADRRRSAAFQNPAPSSAGSLVPYVPPGPTGRLDDGSC
jgi:hypothetical protein